MDLINERVFRMCSLSRAITKVFCSCGQVLFLSFTDKKLTRKYLGHIYRHTDTGKLGRVVEIGFAHTVHLEPAYVETSEIITLDTL